MTRRNRTYLLAALAALLTSLPAAPALANTDAWVPVPCATGAIADQHVETSGGLFPTSTAHISGWMQPCTDPAPNASFAVIPHYAGAAVLNTRFPPLIAYPPSAAPTSFTAQTLISQDPEFGPLQALCIMSSPDVRVACIAVDAYSGTDEPIVYPIALDDWRVRNAHLVYRSSSGGTTVDPACGTCV